MRKAFWGFLVLLVVLIVLYFLPAFADETLTSGKPGLAPLKTRP